MSVVTLRCQSPDPVAFAAYGSFVTPPARYGERAFFSAHLGGGGPGAKPVLHVNKVRAVALPYEITSVERHPRAGQIFLPLDVSRYLAVVMPSDLVGNPVPELAQAFLIPGTIGVVYHAKVWHAGAAVLDRAGNFAVLMWRRDDAGDDEFRAVARLVVDSPVQRPALAHTLTEDTE